MVGDYPKVGAVFVDGANMSRALTARSRALASRTLLDYGLLVEALDRLFGMRFVYRTYYTTHQDEESIKRRMKFYDHLRAGGWTVFDFPAKRVVNSDHPDGVWMDKGIDLAIGLDAYRLALLKQVSVLAVATHDTDFVQLFNRLPTSVTGAVIGWKEWLSLEFKDPVQRVYLNDLKVLRR